MELGLEIHDIAAPIGQRITLTTIVTNTGSATAEAVEVELDLPELDTGNGRFWSKIFTPSQGNLEEATHIWNLGNLGAGQSVTLIMEANPLGLNSGVTVPIFAQVTRAHGYDSDSDVNNGTDQIADEDDEGVLIFGDDRKIDVLRLVDDY